jgi:two-component system chemotaxis sensor kinase CheA
MPKGEIGMKMLWQKIINIGIDENTDEEEIMYIQVCNGLSVLVSIWMLSLVPLVLNKLPDSRVFVINGLLFPMLWPLILAMNYKRKYMLARIYLTATSAAIITINTLSAGAHTENHLFIVMYIASAFVTYPKTKHFLMVAAFGLINFGFIEYWSSFHEPFIPSNDPSYFQLIRFLSVTNIPVLFIIMSLYHKNLLLKTQRRLKERTQAYQNLLDNAGQGFFTFDRQLIVQEEHSIECRRLFGKDISGAKFTSLLNPHDEVERQLQEDILNTVFQEDQLEREVCLTLLPNEVDLQGRRVALEYQWIVDVVSTSPRMMVVMTDVSEKRELEQRMAEERQVMRMVIWVVKHNREFREIVNEYRAFAQEGKFALLRNRASNAAEKWAELYLIVHTLKGNFAQIDFVHLTRRLHELESALSEWKVRNMDRLPDDQATAALAKWFGTNDMVAWLEEDLSVLREVLGDTYDFEHMNNTSYMERIPSLVQKIRQWLPEREANELIDELNTLKHRPFKDMLALYPNYIAKLAERTGKSIHPIELTGDDLLVDPDRYADFVRSLIHVCRNMVDHGIEPPEERLMAGKDAFGCIRIECASNGESIRLSLFNDGAEMDLAAIRRRAIEQGICTSEQLAEMSAAEQRMLVLHEGFTTKRAVTELSGRGMGLSAVFNEVRKLGGALRIDSDPAGTRFTFELPQVG